MKIETKRLTQNIEETAASLLEEDKLKAFLDFHVFLINNKIGKRKSGKFTWWAITYNNKRICSLSFHENSWVIRYFNMYQRDKWFERFEKYLTVELKNFILDNINTTTNCCVNRKCNSVENKIILGKLFKQRVCQCSPIMLYNPNGKALEYAKELVLIGKKTIAETAESGIK